MASTTTTTATTTTCPLHHSNLARDDAPARELTFTPPSQLPPPPSPPHPPLPPPPPPSRPLGFRDQQVDEHHLDASLRDFEPPASSPVTTTATSPSSTRQSSAQPSDAATEEESIISTSSMRLQHHGKNIGEDSDMDSAAGGFSPPAWRRLGNGGRSSGFWKDQRHDVLAAMPRRASRPCWPFLQDEHVDSDFQDDEDDDDDDDEDEDEDDMKDKMEDETEDYDDDDNDNDENEIKNENFSTKDTDVLERAVQTRLPTGSISPDKVGSPSPQEKLFTIKAEPLDSAVVLAAPSQREAQPENYIRFAIRAEVHQRTEPIEATISFIRKRYQAATSSWGSLLMNIAVVLFSITTLNTLLQPVSSRPAGDLVKVAGIARSFEPLIYYSENAVAQVHDLQATSVAVGDLGESVRTSGMHDAVSIVYSLEGLSYTLRTLSVEMTKFFARVDGDIDSILNVMEWAKMHLQRLNSAPPPSTVAAAYDNMHNLLSRARVLEDAAGSPTRLGRLATNLFGLSNPQREQRLIQLLFTEFLTVLEDSIAEELQHSITLFALFETIDHHFLNLARTVVRESSTQEELQADMLSSLWVRILGAHAAQLRKFERNRELLRSVRDKTLLNRRILVDHHGKLLTLKASLESLRARLVSPLVRGVNATTLSLADQIRGISSVTEYLVALRRQQKAKVLETLFASVPGQRIAMDEAMTVGGFGPNGEKI